MFCMPYIVSRRRIVLKKIALACVLCLALTVGVSAQGENPEQVVRAFLDAWSAGDTAKMYTYLSPTSKSFYPQEAFAARYARVHDAMDFNGLSYTLGDIEAHDVVAAVHYDVTIDAGSFGTIEDAGRIIRLVKEGSVWGVAWSSLDIFPTLTANAEMTSSGRLAQRADIYDRNGNPVASQGEIVVLYGVRQNMSDQSRCEIRLAQLTRRSQSSFQSFFANYGPETIFFLVEMPSQTYYANQAEIDPLCGVYGDYTNTYQTRVYYGGGAMTTVTGWVGAMTQDQQADYLRRGYSIDARIGQSGIERGYESVLAGTPERVLRISEPGGVVLAEYGSTAGSPPNPVRLTIDRDLQVAVADAMADAYTYAIPDWASVAGGGAAAVIDVNTGAILAMVSYPLVDPLLFNPASQDQGRGERLTALGADNREPLKNHVLQEQYTPGSVYKIITLAAVLNEGIVSPQDTFDCQLDWSGQEKYGDSQASRPDWRKTDDFPPAGIITPAEALMASCNPFFWEFGAQLYQRDRKNTLGEYAQRMGLGRAYNIYNYPLMVAGDLDDPTTNAAPFTAAINDAIGQGDVAIPPLQMAVAVAAIANGGTVYEPYLVQQIGPDGAPISTTAPNALNTLDFNPGVLETIREGMCGVIENEDLGTAYIRFRDRNYHTVAPYTLCGKTGTAETLRYPNAWFVTYAPAENPQIATVVMVPQSLEGSQVAAPITRRILDYYFRVPDNQYAAFPEWWAEPPYDPLKVPEG